MNKLFVGLLLSMPLLGQAAQWLPVRDSSLEIVAGTALDFSNLVEAGMAGQHGRIISNHGHLAYADSPDTARRFFCASQPHGAGGEFPDHATAARFAKQVRLHGYNVARFHFVEHDLMYQQTQDFVFNAEQLDRFHYFLAALKREGVYWLMDGMSSWNGAYGDVGEDRWIFKYDTKLRIYFDEAVKAHWQRLVQQVLNQKNPYTQLTPLQDPALLGVILVNEGGLNHAVNLDSAELANLQDLSKQFANWLVKKYGSMEQAFAVWGETPTSLNMLMARHDWNATTRMRDTQLFYYEMQQQTLQWMTEYLRHLGYQGLITAYDNWASLQDSASREPLDWIDIHGYDEEPSDWIKAGSTLKQQSSFTDQLAYIRDLASSRYLGKPFTVSEYDQPFWGKYRYETGLAIGAYASLQNWDLICRHSGAVELAYYEKNPTVYTRQAIHPFDVGMDPIARADETLAALLFARQDVKPALHHVNLQLTADYVFNQQAGIGKLPEQLTNIALVTGLGLTWQAKVFEKATVIQPNGPAPSLFDKALVKLEKGLGLSNSDWLAQLRIFKETQVLPIDNLSDGKHFQSDTKEINLDTDKQTLSVNTDKTEAVAFADKLPKPLRHLTIDDSSSPALLAASALDNMNVVDSQRLLLIYATDARNTDMQFNDKAERSLKQLGHLPVQLKNTHIRFTLTNAHAHTLHLYALHLNGERAAELPLEQLADDKLRIQLDLSTSHPTTYFELATQ